MTGGPGTIPANPEFLFASLGWEAMSVRKGIPERRAVTPKTVARTVVVGGGAAGIGAAGAAKAADPSGEVVVFTEYEDCAYSPCGIPYLHGQEIPHFDPLFLAGQAAYVAAWRQRPYQRM